MISRLCIIWIILITGLLVLGGCAGNINQPINNPDSLLYIGGDGYLALMSRNLSTGKDRQVCVLTDEIVDQLISVDSYGRALLLITRARNAAERRQNILSLRSVDLHNGRTVSNTPVRLINHSRSPFHAFKNECIISGPSGLYDIALVRQTLRIVPWPGQGRASVQVPISDEYRIQRLDQAAFSQKGDLAVLVDIDGREERRVMLVQNGKLVDSGISAYSIAWLPTDARVLSVISAPDGYYEEYNVLQRGVKRTRRNAIEVSPSHEGIISYGYPVDHMIPQGSQTIYLRVSNRMQACQPIYAGRIDGNGAIQTECLNIGSETGLWMVYRESSSNNGH